MNRNSPNQSDRVSAVALAYQEGDGAPRVVAKGRGRAAENIIAKARESGVYVHESPELLGLLMQIDLDDRIPSQLYVAVAELLAWLYRIEQGSAPEIDTTPGQQEAQGTGRPSTATG